MTPQEFRKEIMKFRASIGSEAYVSAGIALFHRSGNGSGTLDCTVYPNGLGHNSSGNFTVYAEDWAELLSGAQSKWSEHHAEYAKQQTRKIALEIIRLTADLGHCTDAALRDKFTPDLIKQFGADAVKDANKIAQNGPFEIVSMRGANGAPADIEVRDPARAH